MRLQRQASNHVLQDYEMQLILLEQQKKKKLIMLLEQQKTKKLTMAKGVDSNGEPQDYQTQLMLLEQDKHGKAWMARFEEFNEKQQNPYSRGARSGH